MSFAVFTDSCSNLPGSLLQHFGIRVLPCSYTVDGKQIIYGGDIEAFDAHTYYELLRQGKRVTTSLLNTQVFLDHFRPALEQGLDVVYVGLSAGISGTYQAACIAAAELRDEFPERTVCPWTPWVRASAPACWPAAQLSCGTRAAVPQRPLPCWSRKSRTSANFSRSAT